MVENLIITALIICLLGMVTFAYLFATKTNWQHSALGRHMVYFSVFFSIVILTNLLRVIIDGQVIDVIRVVSLFALAAVTWQRVFIMVKALR